MLKKLPVKTFLFKACPRCQGDLALDREAREGLVSEELQYYCLQCGGRIDAPAANGAQKKPATAGAAR